MRTRPIAPLALVLALVASCAQFPAASERKATDPAGDAATPKRDGGWGGSKLYARDGSVVAGAETSQEGATAAPRELAPSEGGRMYILELYQKAIDERDALEIEVRSLQSELERAKQGLLGSDRDLTSLQARIAQLESENKRLLEENLDLAARLTTAQIRRLQCEKILLETRIAEIKTNALPSEPAAEKRQ